MRVAKLFFIVAGPPFQIHLTESFTGIAVNGNRAGVGPLLDGDWGSFQALDDDDEIFGKVDGNTYAEENDSQEYKAEVGSSLKTPTIERPAEPISVPAGEFVRIPLSRECNT